MRENRRRRYDDGFRHEALELIKSGAGKDTLVRRLAIPVYTARNWIGLYRSNGEEAVMGGGGSRRYDWETKVAAARDHVENGLTKTEAMASKEIVAWDVSRSPDLGQQKRLPAGAEPILHSDMGWQYQHQWWRKELERLGIRQSMSRKGNCLDNAATEQVFGHLKDEFYRGRESSTRTNSSNASWTPTSSIGTPDDARYDSRDAPRRSSGACPSRSDPVSQLTTSNKRGAVQ